MAHRVPLAFPPSDVVIALLGGGFESIKYVMGLISV